MGKRLHTPLWYETVRLLHRGSHSELWLATVRNHDCILRRYRAADEDQFLSFDLHARINHPLLLRPLFAGGRSAGHFCVAMPVNFQPAEQPGNRDPFSFATGFLSLGLALSERKLAFKWNSAEIIWDEYGKAYLPGFATIREASESSVRHNTGMLLQRLRLLLGELNDQRLVATVKKWERRKDRQIENCLSDLLKTVPNALPDLVCFFECYRQKEQELLTGLFHLAESNHGRAVLFHADAGEGKSTLLRQIYRGLLPRSVLVTMVSAEKEDRPYQMARDLIDQFLENSGGYRRWRNDSSLFRMLDGSAEISEDLLSAKLLDLIRSYSKETSRVCAFLVDNIDLADAASQSFLLKVWKQLHDVPVLFIATTRNNVDTGPGAIHLALEPVPLTQLEQNVFVPLWQPQQRRTFLKQIYDRTSGNPLLFCEYLKETLRQKGQQIVWKDSHWFFPEPGIPQFPEALVDFYSKRLPALSEHELSFLGKASIQGERFDPELIDEVPQKSRIVMSLVGAGIISERNGKLHFQQPLLAESLYQRMEGETKRDAHLKLAQELMKREKGSRVLAARHLLKAQDVTQALQHLYTAVQEEASPAANVLPLLEELEGSSGSLPVHDKKILYLMKGDLLSRIGKYPAAASSYAQVLEYSEGHAATRFEAAVKAAESYVLQNDILSAIKLLNENGSSLKEIQNQKLLFQYYFTKGICSWHRGGREPEDFAKAFEIAQNRQDYRALASGYRQQAGLVLQDGALDQARALAHKSMRYARKCRNDEEIGHLFRILASISWRQSRYKMAERLLKRSISTFQKASHYYGMACAWNLLANVYVERYRFTDAIRSFEKAILIFNQLGHPMEVSLAQFNLGLVFLEEGKLNEAENIFLRCLAIDRKSGNKRYYAYDIRALAVYNILRGFYKKAGRLLNRTIEICEDIGADGDVLQTKMILLLNELEQRSHQRSEPLARFLTEQLKKTKEPRTISEIHHLLGYYYLFQNEPATALRHFEESLSLSRPIAYYKLIAKNLILRLILQNQEPSTKHPDLREAFHYFRKSQCDVEFCDYLLKLCQAYPAMAKKYSRKLDWMEKIYRTIRNRPRHRAVRKLLDRISPRRSNVEPLYEWWQDLMKFLDASDPLEIKLTNVLKSLLGEFRSSFALAYFLSSSGTYSRVLYPDDERSRNIAEDLPSRVLELTLRNQNPACWSMQDDAALSKTSWAVLNEVSSVLAVPVIRSGQLLALWYIERRGVEPAFTARELQKASFFGIVSAPLLESAFQKAFNQRGVSSLTPAIRVEGMVGSGKAMRDVYRHVEKLAPVDVNVLITGESGTGKELIAQCVHRNSRRDRGPFLPLNCSALPETLIESELFGYNRGAFTGAVISKPGMIERANGGTLFLDEIGDLSASAQAKLLRAIQEKEIQRLGDTAAKRIDVRFLFATHKDLKRMTRDGQFREDLFYRISAHTVHLPALRERKEDIPELLAHFARKYSLSFQKGNMSFSPSALRVLVQYTWPGNVREMENVVQQILLNADPDAVILPDALPPEVTGEKIKQRLAGLSLDEARSEFEREFLLDVLNRFKWNKTRASKELKISRQGLIQMIQRLGLSN